MDFMLLVGKFIAAGLVAVAVLVLIAVFGFRFWVQRTINKMLDMPNSGMPIINQPRVKLTAHRGETAHQAEVNQLIAEAENLGFHLIEPNHLFEADLPHGFFLYLLQNNEKTQHITIYDSENLVKPIIDMMQCYQDRTIYGISNTPFTSLPYPSNIRTVKLPTDKTLTELWEYMTTNAPAENMQVVQSDQLCGVIEQLYGIQQDYLIHLNFSDYDYAKEQVDKFIETNQQKFTPEQYEEMVTMIQTNMREGYEYNIPDVVKERFLKENKIDAAKWNEYDENIVIIHERQTSEILWNDYFQHYFTECVHDEKRDEWVDQPLVDDSTIVELAELQATHMDKPLDYVNAVLPLLPKERQVKKLGRVDYPVNAEFYYFT